MAYRIFIGVIVILSAYLVYELARVKTLHYSARQAADAHVLGNPQGDLTLVNFFEYDCAQCRASLPLIEEAVRQDGQVKFIPRPISFLSSEGVDPSLLLYAAAKHGKFKQMHEILLNSFRMIDGEVFNDMAREVGIDAEVLKADVKSKEIAELADKNKRLFQQLRLTGTPAYIIGEDILFVSERNLSTNEFTDFFKEARGQ